VIIGSLYGRGRIGRLARDPLGLLVQDEPARVGRERRAFVRDLKALAGRIECCPSGSG